jgi:hypothetical protein
VVLLVVQHRGLSTTNYTHKFPWLSSEDSGSIPDGSISNPARSASASDGVFCYKDVKMKLTRRAFLFFVIGLSGCTNGIPQTPTVPKGNVVKIIATQNCYNVLIEDEGKVITKQYYHPYVTFAVDVKVGEKMWIEAVPNNSNAVVIHVHSVDNDIHIGTTSGK